MNGSGQGLNLAPATMMNTQAMSLAPFTGQALTLSPMIAGQSLSLSPTTLSLSPQTAYYVTSGTTSGASLALAPQSMFQLVGATNSGATHGACPQRAIGVQTLSFSGVPTAEHGMQVLSIGFGGNQAKVNGFLQTLKTKLEGLVGAVGKNLTKQDVTNLLMTTANDALASSGFGFLSPGLDVFLKPLIDKLVGDRLSPGADTTTPTTGTTTPTTGTTTPVAGTTTVTVPLGGMSFTVSGTITLTPASGGTQITAPNPGTVTPPVTGAGGNLRQDPGGSAAPSIGGP